MWDILICPNMNLAVTRDAENQIWTFQCNIVKNLWHRKVIHDNIICIDIMDEQGLHKLNQSDYKVGTVQSDLIGNNYYFEEILKL